jgi:hypothetical protein
MNRIELPTWLVAGVLLLLLAAVGVAGWAIGRSSVPATPVASLAPAPEGPADTGFVPERADAGDDWKRLLPEDAPEEPIREARAKPDRAKPPGQKAASKDLGDDGVRGDVAAYFTDLDAITVDHPSHTGDPQGHAESLVAAAMSGDTTGLDELISANSAMVKDIGSLSPPSPCREHHRRTLAVVNDSTRILQDLKSAMTTSDLGGLMAMQSKAGALEAELKAVDALGESIRAEYQL